ncbi:MAG: hypothetical protein HY673_17530 [Chloroflexi bacterium]|nr:hypothetical protein [Chloroflexota bacterium]
MRKVVRMLALAMVLFSLSSTVGGPSVASNVPSPVSETDMEYQAQPARSGKLSPSLEKLLSNHQIEVRQLRG